MKKKAFLACIILCVIGGIIALFRLNIQEEKEDQQIEYVPEQIYIELGSGDYELNKIGEVRYTLEGWSDYYTGDLYELDVPKYHIKFQFPQMKASNTKEKNMQEKALRERQWSQSGMIRIPGDDLGIGLFSDRPDSKIAIFSTEHLREDTPLEEVGKTYKKVYEDVFYMRDWKGYEEKLEEGLKARGEERRIEGNKEALERWQKYFNFVVYDGPLPQISGENNLYGVDNKYQLNWYGDGHSYIHEIASGWYIMPNVKEEQRKRRGDEQDYAHIYWSKNNPQFMFVHIQSISGTGKLIFE